MNTPRKSDVPRRADPSHLRMILALSVGSALYALVMCVVWFLVRNLVLLDAFVSLIIWSGILLCVGLSTPLERPRGTKGAWNVAALGAIANVTPDTIRVATLIVAGVAMIGGPLLRLEYLAVTHFTLYAVAWSALGTSLNLLVAVRFARIERESSPYVLGICRGTRIIAWVLALSSLAALLGWLGQLRCVTYIHAILLALNCILWMNLLLSRVPRSGCGSFPDALGIFTILGSRMNPVASALDAAQIKLGIDLRSTWAISMVRRSAEPLVFIAMALAWVSTSVTVVGLAEQGVVERLGTRVTGGLLNPGIHIHWPWPIDRVSLVPVERVQMLHIGHAGEEEEQGPEDVLWARQHSSSEYTLLLGNGRDLIAIDAVVQFKIVDPLAWRYHNQNPAEAIRASAYRAVMKSTVSRTLTDTLSENVAVLTSQMRSMVQADADSLGLGVRIVAFTIGGMHPPVRVASDYQAVVSAELGKSTAIVGARADAYQTIPEAKAQAVKLTHDAHAEATLALGRARGEAASYAEVARQYSAAPQVYRFRRRIETLERALPGRSYVVIDQRVERDGGAVWLTK